MRERMTSRRDMGEIRGKGKGGREKASGSIKKWEHCVEA
jgi:hypothetical protein